MDLRSDRSYSDATKVEPTLWHILSVSSVPVREFAMAMHRAVPTLAWIPQMSMTGYARDWIRTEICETSGLQELHFPLQRGYARKYVERFVRSSRRITELLTAQSGEPTTSALVCTSPFWAPVAERWPGPIVYYATDLTVAYASLKASQVKELDARLCRVADLVCPNSQRIAQYLQAEAGCNPELIRLIPNATRASNIRATSHGPLDLPLDVAEINRPIAGIIGNLASNIDWVLLLEAIDRAPSYTWLLVGPSSMRVADPEQREARRKTLQHPRVKNIGVRPYELLRDYARAFDVAVLPYRHVEPTLSGSSTRFYEHLAACRPMLATRGVDELLTKVPLVRLFDTSFELAEQLLEFSIEKTDRLEEMRRVASVTQTWENRADRMIDGLREMQGRKSIAS
ncbi:MAG: family glycosyltransferase [Acidobacteriaceae bacterium]|nr:family glycosyltransferase [Acidobacteriaceae bacterium]